MLSTTSRLYATHSNEPQLNPDDGRWPAFIDPHSNSNVALDTCLQLDFAGYDDNSVLNNINGHKNGNSEMHRSRLYLRGSFEHNWQFKLEFKFEGTTGTKLTDTSLSYTGNKGISSARFSQLDLNDEPVNGGKETDISLGLSWYPTSNFRVYSEWIQISKVAGGSYPDSEENLMQARLQFYW